MTTPSQGFLVLTGEETLNKGNARTKPQDSVAALDHNGSLERTPTEVNKLPL
jgi:hypothetical protein